MHPHRLRIAFGNACRLPQRVLRTLGECWQKTRKFKHRATSIIHVKTVRSIVAEKGLEISTLAVVDVRGRTGYAINTQQTIDSDNDETSRIVQYIQQIRDNQSALQMLRVTHLVADGYYSKSSFIDAVTSCGFQYVGKLRRDANLWWPYNGQQNKRGRKRKYGDKVDINDDISQWHECYTEDDGTRVYSAQMHSKFLKRCINVVLMRRTDQDNKQRQAILFSTDTKLDAKKIVD